MKTLLTTAGKYLWDGFGFTGALDFVESAFHPKSLLLTTSISGSLAVAGAFLEEALGLKPIVYLVFVILAVIEFVTGIRAAIKEGQKIESRKFGRMIIKLGTYTIMIALINVLKNHLDIPLIFGEEVNIYSWVYYAIVNMILIQLIISVLENLGRLGYAETNRITQFLYHKLNRWFSIDERKPVTEENEEDAVDEIEAPPGAEDL